MMTSSARIWRETNVFWKSSPTWIQTEPLDEVKVWHIFIYIYIYPYFIYLIWYIGSSEVWRCVHCWRVWRCVSGLGSLLFSRLVFQTGDEAAVAVVNEMWWSESESARREREQKDDLQIPTRFVFMIHFLNNVNC